jgi:exodeoxyribonuclease V gamma subunit
LALLEVPALRKKFAIDEAAVPKLHQWINESGIRWGLNRQQRQATVDMPSELTANTWEFGLQRMLLGYAVGAGETFNGIEPYAEIGGLDAQWLGGLAWLQEKLEHSLNQLSQQHSVDSWYSLLQQLLEDFFIATSDKERKTLDLLNQSLSKWQGYCQQGGLSADQQLPIQVVREAWLSHVDEPNLQQRFLSGRVNFCTLMPMRAIPFKLVCILGMNDGDYPRSHQPQSFDLMSQRGHYRPGDRSRRQDDQYLFLEALLSAREQLYISWVGRSIRDNTERPASVLVSQLRDFLAQGWRLVNHDDKWLDAITVEHPLQPFSQDYIKTGRDARLFTYSKVWFETDSANRGAEGVLNNAIDLPTAISIEGLGRFLKAPVKTFCQSTLKFSFDDDSTSSEDNEPFEFNRLESHVHTNQLLAAIKNHPAESLDSLLQQEYERMVAKGMLPLAGFSKLTFDGLSAGVTSAWQRYQTLLAAWSTELEAESLVLDLESEQGAVKLTGDLVGLHQNAVGQTALIVVVPQSLAKDKKISYHRLMTDWVRHLAACAAGLSIRTFIVAADEVLEIAPLFTEDAKACLASLISAWHEGLQTPLPVEVKTAFVWLESNNESEALKKYEGSEFGGDWGKGEVDYDGYLRRFFPNFDDLNPGQADDKTSFDYWAIQLYQTAFTEIHIATGEQA